MAVCSCFVDTLRVGEAATGDDKKLVEVRFSSLRSSIIHVLTIPPHLFLSIVSALSESPVVNAATSSEASRHPSESSRDHALVSVARCQQMSPGHCRGGCSKHNHNSSTKECRGESNGSGSGSGSSDRWRVSRVWTVIGDVVVSRHASDETRQQNGGSLQLAEYRLEIEAIGSAMDGGHPSS
jgi:hypothetical protein